MKFKNLLVGVRALTAGLILAAVTGCVSLETLHRAQSSNDQIVLAKIALEDEDSYVRTTAVKKLADRIVLAKIAVEDRDYFVRLTAVEKLIDQPLLAKIAVEDESYAVRCAAAENKNLTDLSLLAKIAVEDTNFIVRNAAARRFINQNSYLHTPSALKVVVGAKDQATITRIALEDQDPDIRIVAVDKLTDQAALEKIVAEEKDENIRLAAVGNLTDQTLLAKLAIEDSASLVRAAASRKVTDPALLAKIATESTQSDDTRVRLLMEQYDFAKAKNQDTSQAWKAFLKRWPKSSQSAEARRFLEATSMQEAFAKAKEFGTSEAFEAFLKQWPKSPMAPEAETLLEELSFAAIQKNPMAALCRTHLARFKQGKYSTEVSQILKPLEANERITSAATSEIRSDLMSVIQDYPDNEMLSRIRDILANRDKEVLEQCQATLGGKLDHLESGPVFLESCAWAKIAQHTAFSGDYLGIVASVPANSQTLHLSKNTFLEYEDGTFGQKWVVWFPDWEYRDCVYTMNGTSISAEIEMPGFKKGEAWGRNPGISVLVVSMGYGSMLSHKGRGNIHWNMAYSNAGKEEGSLDIDASGAPSTRRFLLLFPKYTSPVKRVSIGGNVFSTKQ
jgi:TolA-binding protein